MITKLTIGSRSSALARWQTEFIRQQLISYYPKLTVELIFFTTRGDKIIDQPLPEIGGKGLFTAELENSLHRGEIDLAVHSLKDLPVDNPPGLTIGAIPHRANPADILISRTYHSIDHLPQGATIGTSSLRRIAQLKRRRPDVQIADIRGNIDTRIKKAYDSAGIYDGILLAHAGVDRLNQTELIRQTFPPTSFLPAPGQGALAIQCREDKELITFLAPLHDPITAHAVYLERTFLSCLGGGCAVPIGAYAFKKEEMWYFYGNITSLMGDKEISIQLKATDHASHNLGKDAAQTALDQGAMNLLQEIHG